ncbi:GntR family transcriptional regulator [Frankia canadensis]|uniref:GntR family transcriptional regulator n=1 Tax=Frankia canadensis TaxID=1836972 RepID=A0A2I2KN42_9ACTN|nr:GntR family transcriptional regulator [Frankia canadensis]SNQ47076.1 GntR family transcriptional regulator [Frankia canadensis]SOU54366.1 GntR family transcriptional regulator [Frankia canadensis]
MIAVTDGGDGRALYIRIGDDIRSKIASGEIASGARVGSESSLAAEWNTTRETVRKALEVLRVEGWIVRQHGRGSFARRRPAVDVQWATDRYQRSASGPTSPFARDTAKVKATPDWQWVTRRERADPDVAARLGIDVGEHVMRTEYVFRANGEPTQTSVSWEPFALVGGTPIEEPEGGDGPVGVVARFDSIGVLIDAVEEIVTARPATDSERAALSLASGAWVQVVERTHLAGDRRVETADIVRPAEQAARGYRIPIPLPAEKDRPAATTSDDRGTHGSEPEAAAGDTSPQPDATSG